MCFFGEKKKRYCNSVAVCIYSKGKADMDDEQTISYLIEINITPLYQILGHSKVN